MIRKTASVLAVLGLACAEPKRTAAAEQMSIDAPVVVAPEPLAPSAPVARFTSEIARWQDRASTVSVLVETPHGRGSGVIVSREGDIVTAAHVVDPADEHAVVVTLPNGQERSATVVRRASSQDLVLLHVRGTLPVCAPVTPSRVAVGAWMLCAGAVGVEHAELDASIGTVTSSGRTIASSCPIGRGMSGGPALDVEGRVIGVIARYVGAGSELSSLDARSDLLAGITCDSEPMSPMVGLDAAERSALAAPSPHPSAVLVTLEPPYGMFRAVSGVVVAPGVVLTVSSPGITFEPNGAPRMALTIEGQPAAHAVSGEVAGELTRLVFEGLTAPPIATPQAHVLRGSIVTSPSGVGIVSRADATPGRIVPYIAVTPSRCGHRTMLMRQAHPIVTLAHAFVHDASAQRGELLVDADGLPLGIHVSEQGGIGFAVPLADALALF